MAANGGEAGGEKALLPIFFSLSLFKVLESRSWQSMKERFRRSILNRLDSFDLSEELKQQLRQGGKGVRGRGGRGRSQSGNK